MVFPMDCLWWILIVTMYYSILLQIFHIFYYYLYRRYYIKVLSLLGGLTGWVPHHEADRTIEKGATAAGGTGSPLSNPCYSAVWPSVDRRWWISRCAHMLSFAVCSCSLCYRAQVLKYGMSLTAQGQKSAWRVNGDQRIFFKDHQFMIGN